MPFSPPTIVALDFETANRDASSACQLGLVRLENWEVAQSASWLMRPPSRNFLFTNVHGIAWKDVEDKPDLGELWPEIGPLLSGAHFFAAHNASFDRDVLNASCVFHKINPPDTPFLDSVGLARRFWSIYPTTLDRVCARLNIPLNHHEALSDALACAQILLQAHRSGWTPF